MSDVPLERRKFDLARGGLRNRRLHMTDAPRPDLTAAKPAKNAPMNRFDIQIVFDDGSYVKSQCPGEKGKRLSRAEVFAQLRKFIADFDKSAPHGSA